MRKMTLAFYGTLKRGFRNHINFCKNAVNIENAVVAGTLYDSGRGFPVLCVPESSVIVHSAWNLELDAEMQSVAAPGWTPDPRGEVHVELMDFESPDEDIPPIDRLEGVPHFYRRVLVPAKAESGRILAAWIYVMPHAPSGARPIPSGTWTER